MGTNLLEREKHEVLYGNTTIPFSLSFTNRKTLAIHVYPDTSVSIDAPKDVTLEKIKSRVLKRAKWIRKQQRLYERFPPALPARKYTSGESFRYLGRQYVLKVERGLINKVKLERGKLVVHVAYVDQQRIKELVDDWYRARAVHIFNERLQVCLKLAAKVRIDFEGKLSLKVMRTRWGTCTKNSRITINPELVSASKECIDYVILHELCHLREHNHGDAFYRLLESIMPDWKKRKEQLELSAERRLL